MSLIASISRLYYVGFFTFAVALKQATCRPTDFTDRPISVSPFFAIGYAEKQIGNNRFADEVLTKSNHSIYNKQITWFMGLWAVFIACMYDVNI